MFKLILQRRLFRKMDGGDIPTRGKGAGGSKTNLNGLAYEKKTEIKEEIKVIKNEKYHNKIQIGEKILYEINKSNLFNYMEENDKINKSINKAHGCKKPDECYVDEKENIIFIIEKKFQQVNGSVCEKIQTPDFKIWQYGRTFPDYKIVYIYCLSKWFRENCKAELEYLEHKEIPVFIGCNKDYKKNIIKFLIDY